MANRTVKDAEQVHSTNPQFLVEKVIRARVYTNNFWREQCFALTAETLIDKAVDLKYIGGTYGPQIPSPFVCLLLKLLQLQPQREIILEYLTAEDFKYLRALAAMYVRMTFPAMQVYEVLEPMLNDYRKLRYRNQAGSYYIMHMDEFIDELLTQERVCELILPRLTRRDVLEETEGLPPRISKLEDALLLGEANGAGPGAREAQEDADADSDDSLAHERRQRQRRLERAAEIRAKRQAEEERRRGPVATLASIEGAANGGAEDEEDYTSQEESSAGEEGQDAARGRFVSRSPSRSVSPDRVAAQATGANGTGAMDEDEGYRSRSGSRSPDRAGSAPASEGYRSRSGSRSPDR